MDQRIEDWAVEYQWQGEQFSMYHDTFGGMIEAFFPERPDLSRHGKTIDAMLRLNVPEDWPDLELPISEEDAQDIILSVAIADALHETLESLKPRVFPPHVKNEDAMWDLLLSVGCDAAIRLRNEYDGA
jgi:hypothetical protein